MKTPKYSEVQMASILRQVEGGTAIDEACRKAGIAEATFRTWRENMKRLRHLEEENAKLKKLAAELSLDRAKLRDIIRRKR